VSTEFPLFLSTHLNRVDKKGRVSVPASFRATLLNLPLAFAGVVLFRASKQNCLEGFDHHTMASLSARLDHFDLFSDDQDDLATAIFGDSVQLPFDSEGRIVLPEDLMAHAGITDTAAFVGMGRKFQIWEPEGLAARRAKAHSNIRDKGLTVPSFGKDSGGAS
jgi:MraZ protein